MKHRARYSCLYAFVFLAVLQLSSCALTPNSFHSVTISPMGTTIIGQGGMVAITAGVLNDTVANGGVAFSASPAGIGTLTQTTTTTANYIAPAIVTAETIVSITATSVDFPKKSTTLMVKIEPPPVITTTSLPSATLDQSYSQPITATGGVPPLSWTIASGSLPAGLSLASSTTDTVNITGKPTASGNSTFTVTVTDATGASNTSGSLNIVVSTLAFTTTSPLPPGTVNTIYPNVQFAATGGTSPYTFALASGSSLPPGLNLVGGLLSGTPTTAGTFNFGVTLTDSGTPPAVITQTFTLVVTGAQNLALLTNSYAFTFSGNNAAGFIAAAGTFTANGAGAITGGEATYNSIAGAPILYTNITGTYTAGTDGRGTITFTTSTPAFPSAPTYAFSIDPAGSGHGRLIEFDSTGTRGSGRIEAQSVTTCVVAGVGSTYIGNFAFGGSGFTSSAGPSGAGLMAFAGAFTAIPPVAPSSVGSLGPGEIDANVPGSVPLGSGGGSTFSGNYQPGADSSYCTFQLSAAIATLDYNVYPISATDAFFIQSDQVSAINPYVSIAEMRQQFGQPFQPTALGGNMAGGVSGEVLAVPYVSVIQIVPQVGGTSLQLSLTDNEGGTITSTQGNPFSSSYSTDQFGRVFTGLNINTAFVPLLYLIDSQDAFVIGQLNGAPIFGEVDAQSPEPVGGFTTQFIAQNSSLVEGTAQPAVAASRDLSGFLTFDGSVTPTVVGGMQDESTTAANTTGETVTGTYALSGTGTTDGSGTITLTSPAAFTGAFYFVSPTKLVMITTTAGDTTPILIVAGH
jgi:Putative Ig domain